MPVKAIIHLDQKSRWASGRIGQFVRPSQNHPLHLWKGRELTVEEFNAEWPKAVKSVTEDVHAKILIEPESAASGENFISKEAHEKALNEAQAAVDEFTKQCNDKLAALQKALDEAALREIDLKNKLASLETLGKASDGTSGETGAVAEKPAEEQSGGDEPAESIVEEQLGETEATEQPADSNEAAGGGTAAEGQAAAPPADKPKRGRPAKAADKPKV